MEFPDGGIEEFLVNVLAESLFNQADLGGWDTGLIDEVIDVRKYPSTAAEKEDEILSLLQVRRYMS